MIIEWCWYLERQTYKINALKWIYFAYSLIYLQLNTQDTCLGATSVSFTAWRPTRSTRGCHIGGAISRLRLNPWTGNTPPWKSWRPQKNGCACMRSCTKRRSDVSHYVIIIRLICVENTEKFQQRSFRSIHGLYLVSASFPGVGAERPSRWTENRRSYRQTRAETS